MREHGDAGERGEGDAEPAERVVPGEEVADERVDGEADGEREQPAEAGNEEPRPAHPARAAAIDGRHGGGLGEGIGLRREHRRRADAGHIVGRRSC